MKKIFLQGKPYTEENVFHMKRELGDICWYLAQACMALDTTFDEVIEMNVEKLKARYPGGEFDVHKSENRKEGDFQINLELDRRDAIVLRHHLFLYTKRSSWFLL